MVCKRIVVRGSSWVYGPSTRRTIFSTRIPFVSLVKLIWRKSNASKSWHLQSILITSNCHARGSSWTSCVSAFACCVWGEKYRLEHTFIFCQRKATGRNDSKWLQRREMPSAGSEWLARLCWALVIVVYRNRFKSQCCIEELELPPFSQCTKPLNNIL